MIRLVAPSHVCLVYLFSGCFCFDRETTSALRHVDLGWKRESQFCVTRRVFCCCFVSGSSIDCGGLFIISSFHCWCEVEAWKVWVCLAVGLAHLRSATAAARTILFGDYFFCGFNLLPRRDEIRWIETEWPVMRWSGASVCIDVFGICDYNLITGHHLLHL